MSFLKKKTSFLKKKNVILEKENVILKKDDIIQKKSQVIEEQIKNESPSWKSTCAWKRARLFTGGARKSPTNREKSSTRLNSLIVQHSLTRMSRSNPRQILRIPANPVKGANPSRLHCPGFRNGLNSVKKKKPGPLTRFFVKVREELDIVPAKVQVKEILQDKKPSIRKQTSMVHESG